MPRLPWLAFVCALTGVSVSCRPAVPPPPAEIPEEIPDREDSQGPDVPRVIVTERAAAEVRKYMSEVPGKTYVLRVRYSPADHDFKLDLDEITDPRKDLKNESAGVTVVVDRASATLLPPGVVVDFVERDRKRGFQVNPPVFDKRSVDLSVTLTEARKGFRTTLRPHRGNAITRPAPTPPPETFGVVRYDAAPGKMVAYLTPDPGDGKKHPAIVWITGGDCNSIDAGCWRDGGPADDQSAGAYRKAGIVMMFPALRGGNDNPGDKEGFLGEVEDVLAATEFLRQQSFVDPDRIYLGGHSTGGTLALLTAEVSDRFRAVFSFGPADDVMYYGPESNPFSFADPREFRLRAPIRWLHSIRRPTFVIEGVDGNDRALRAMADATHNKNVRFFLIDGANHFNILAPTNDFIAARILRDTGPACNLAFTVEELSRLFRK